MQVIHLRTMGHFPLEMVDLYQVTLGYRWLPSGSVNLVSGERGPTRAGTDSSKYAIKRQIIGEWQTQEGGTSCNVYNFAKQRTSSVKDATLQGNIGEYGTGNMEFAGM